MFRLCRVIQQIRIRLFLLCITIYGKIDNSNNIKSPDDARLTAGWFIVGGHSGYVYVYGEGSINKSDNTFTINFEKNPPVNALYYKTEAGIAFVVLTDNSIKQNDILTDITKGLKFYGRMENSAIIYITDTAKIKFPDSLPPFHNGYNFGSAVFSTKSVDYFIPGDKSTAILRIDTTITEFTNVNWF
ncbi:MAG: hypothetical protein JST20_09750 [Bacteroidetes bacterium]|nr:hypothetical protein [Bacteroidota bacterium]